MMTARFLKRALVAIPLTIALLAIGYGYLHARRDHRYRQLVLHGDTAVARGDAKAAVSAFGDAIGLKPDSMVGYLKRGDAHRRAGALDQAAADLETARKLSPNEPRTLELLGDVAVAQQMHDQAVEYYAAYAAIDDRPQALYKLGLARYLAGHTQGAADALRQAVKMDTRFAEAHYLLGVCLRDMKRLQGAESALERAILLSPGLLAAREQLADLYALLGRPPERIKQLEDLLAADASAARHVSLAMAYAESGQPQRAVHVLAVSADLYPAHAATFVALGKVWLDVAAADGDRGALGEALEALERAVSIEASSQALSLLGRARLMASDIAEAERTLRRASETLPLDPSAFLYLADAAELTGHARVARRALLDYRAMTGATDPDFLVRIAHAHWRAGDVNAARETLERVLARDPDNARGRDLERLLR